MHLIAKIASPAHFVGVLWYALCSAVHCPAVCAYRKIGLCTSMNYSTCASECLFAMSTPSRTCSHSRHAVKLCQYFE